jgi:ATP-dependent DNA ligase
MRVSEGAARAKPAKPAGFPLPLSTPPMEARQAESLPSDPGWQFEPKWDGFRCLAFKAGDQVELQAKSGKPLGRYFPEVVDQLRRLPIARFVLDGELAVPIDDSLSFDALQMRLHPAESRIRKLSAETPAVFIAFDLLASAQDGSLMMNPLIDRRRALEGFFDTLHEETCLRLSPFTRKLNEANRWLAKAGGALDGVIAKRTDGPYEPGERSMLKVKRLRTADCVVGGFRYEANSPMVGSLLLGLYNEDSKLDHVGFTATIKNVDRPALTRRLEARIAPPGFTGNAPGGPSRWTTERSADWQPLRPKLVVEVRYDHVTGKRFRHGTTLVRWRPDKAPKQCTFEQLELEARPSKLIRQILEV